MQARALSTFGFATSRGTSHIRYRGIKNLGNTCFLNAVLQSLTSIRSFHVFLATNQGKELNRALRDSLAELCLAKQSSVDPTPITKISPLSRYFGTREQQDAQELMQYLFASLQEDPDNSNAPSLATIHSLDHRDPFVFMKVFVGNESFPISLFKLQLPSSPLRMLPPSHSAPSAATSASSSPSASPSTSASSSLSSSSISTSSSSSSLHSSVSPLPTTSSCPSLNFPYKKLKRNPFAGLLASSLRCNNCQKSSIQFNKFHDLSLSIPEYFIPKRKACTLDQCLKYFTDPESINDVLCGRCNTTSRAEKKLMVARQPRALCLHIRRLVVSRDLRLVKLNSFVEFPPMLDISPYCSFSTLSEDADVEEDVSMSSSGIFGNVKSTKSTREDTSWSLSSLGGLPGGFSSGFGSSLLRPPGVGNTSSSFRSLLYASENTMSTSATPSSSSSPLYDLKAVIVHEGSALGGHFSAYRKLRSRPSFRDREEYLHKVTEVVEKEAKGEGEEETDDEEGWVHISDEKCLPVEESVVFSAQAYMLFYEQIKGKRDEIG